MFKFLIILAGLFCTLTANPAGKVQNPFIVGGTPAQKGEFPWLVYVRCDSGSYCGGTILNQNYIITAAHCLVCSSYTVVAGQYNRRSQESTQQRVKVSKQIPHESYNQRTHANDIALLKLATPLTFNDNVKAAKIATSSTQPEQKLIVAGWGTTRESGSSSDVLLKVTVPLQPASKCERVYGRSYNKASQICAGEGGKDSCQGDSGGPLQNAQDKTIVGVVSFGHGCAREGYPGVYANIAYYANWITARAV